MSTLAAQFSESLQHARCAANLLHDSGFNRCRSGGQRLWLPVTPRDKRILFLAQGMRWRRKRMNHRSNRADRFAVVRVTLVTLTYPNYRRIGFLTGHFL